MCRPFILLLNSSSFMLFIHCHSDLSMNLKPDNCTPHTDELHLPEAQPPSACLKYATLHFLSSKNNKKKPKSLTLKSSRLSTLALPEDTNIFKDLTQKRQRCSEKKIHFPLMKCHPTFFSAAFISKDEGKAQHRTKPPGPKKESARITNIRFKQQEKQTVDLPKSAFLLLTRRHFPHYPEARIIRMLNAQYYTLLHACICTRVFALCFLNDGPE